MDKVRFNCSLCERQEILNIVTPENVDFFGAYIKLPNLHPHSQGHRTHFWSDDMKTWRGSFPCPQNEDM